jgi:hypothetical protein
MMKEIVNGQTILSLNFRDWDQNQTKSLFINQPMCATCLGYKSLFFSLIWDQ